MAWKDVTIARKVYLAFGAVFILTAAVGYVGSNGLHEIRGASDRALLVSRLVELSLEMRRSEKNYMMRREDSYLQKNDNEAQEMRSVIEKLSKDISDKSGQAALAEISSGVDEYKRIYSKWLDKSRELGSKSLILPQPKELKSVEDELIPPARAMQKSCADLLDREKKNMVAAYDMAITLALGVIAGALALAFLAAFVIARSVAKPLQSIARVADAIAGGDIEQSITVNSNDECGKLAKSFLNLIGYVKDLASTAQRISTNDLTVRVEPRSEKDVLGHSFKAMVHNLTGVVRELSENSNQVVAAATEVASTSEEMAKGAQKQSSQASQVSAAVEEMTATIVESSRNAAEAATQAKEAAEAATQGRQIVSQTIDGMNQIAKVVHESAKTIEQLSKSSDQIGEIIGVIDDIADQTNLLALNAAIEAARAGEQGRGFAVVADEVRKLAERTTKATKEITDMIRGIQSETKGAVTSMEQGIKQVEGGRVLASQAGESLGAILGYAQRVREMIQQVASAGEQQSQAAEEIARSVEGIAQVTKQSTMGAEQSASAAEELNRQADGLQQMVARFRVN
jgi:methyl-accepting chemotaxis protein